MNSFAEIVEGVKALSTQEKQELQNLIENYLIEERREEIYQNYIHSLSELDDGKTEFSSDMDKLKGQLLND
jgi:hypothetical protein